MRTIFLSLMLIGISILSLAAQVNIQEDNLVSSTLKVIIKKYEVVQTEIYTKENQLIYANSDMLFIGQKTGLIDTEKLSKTPGLNLHANWKTEKRTPAPNKNSLIYLAKEKVQPTKFKLNSESTTSPKPINISLGHLHKVQQHREKAITPNFSVSNKSITDLPGYIPLVVFNLRKKL